MRTWNRLSAAPRPGSRGPHRTKRPCPRIRLASNGARRSGARRARAVRDDSVRCAFLRQSRLDGIGPTPQPSRRRPGHEPPHADEYVRILGDIHGVDLDRVGLGDFAKREGYLERQVARWTDQWARSKEVDSPEIDALADRLQRGMPRQRETTLVHGDYRLGNVMLDAADTGRVIAVFDWEMSTLGDPLADVGYALLWWGSGDARRHQPAVADLPGSRPAPSWSTVTRPHRAELRRRRCTSPWPPSSSPSSARAAGPPASHRSRHRRPPGRPPLAAGPRPPAEPLNQPTRLNHRTRNQPNPEPANLNQPTLNQPNS